MIKHVGFYLLLTATLAWGSIVSAGTDIQDTVKFNCGTSEQDIQDAGAARVNVGNANIYIGTQQVSNTNQNPIVAAFDATTGASLYCRTDYETTCVEGRGLGLHYNGTSLYGVFSVDGGSTTAFSNAARNNSQSWNRNYGSGGGPKVSVIARLDPADGSVTGATFLPAQLSSGRTNSTSVTEIRCQTNGNLLVVASSFYHPRYINGSRMPVSGDSPFVWNMEITPNLRTLVYSEAQGYVGGTLGITSPCLDSSVIGVRDIIKDVDSSGFVTPADAVAIANRLGTSASEANAYDIGSVNRAKLNQTVDAIGITIP